jgi:chromate transport protein ChrA
VIVLDFFVNIYLTLTTTIGSFLAIWAFVGGCAVPLIIIYLLYKNRKNKDEIIKILKPVIGIIVLVLIALLAGTI